eukprot:CAMPEP_0202688180 /NCGR_PEP_ID=MMETSP1385-20130828/3715_1 /ASSEMBLY_ACC=CAM_ASM_000861 /TAXON_ID=933848 /ORGANISM="Elphidium margaritaceum" /LENGTH=257 /DNA_ID=CAMNT_0049343087 /DNA_START=111 /DNA_END=885 /DNA_ORIENTATION=-
MELSDDVVTFISPLDSAAETYKSLEPTFTASSIEDMVVTVQSKCTQFYTQCSQRTLDENLHSFREYMLQSIEAYNHAYFFMAVQAVILVYYPSIALSIIYQQYQSEVEAQPIEDEMERADGDVDAMQQLSSSLMRACTRPFMSDIRDTSTQSMSTRFTQVTQLTVPQCNLQFIVQFIPCTIAQSQPLTQQQPCKPSTQQQRQRTDNVNNNNNEGERMTGTILILMTIIVCSGEARREGRQEGKDEKGARYQAFIILF